jgi:hypothetical protein
LLDHGSIQESLAAAGARERRAAARQELLLIARYANLRKATSKGASALLLRFFHGYFPVEIAAILQTTTAAVDVRLRIARVEAVRFVADPNRLCPFDQKEAWRDDAGDDGDFVSAIRASLFDAARSSCVSEPALDRLYAASHEEPVDAATLAHFVSCSTCLDRINRRLGLPTLAERDPSERLGRGGRNGHGGSHNGGEGKPSDRRTKLKTRLKDVLDDRPKELSIVINGLFVGSQAVQHGLGEQRLRVLLGERIGFVEIFSEHGVCLLYLDVVSPPDGEAEQGVTVSLSEGRTLSATLAFHEAAPVLHVLYKDPATEAFCRPAGISAPMRSTSGHPERVERRTDRWFPRLATLLTLRPALGILAACAAAVGAWAFWPGGEVSASELLHAASVTESRPLPPGVATHQLVTIEHRLLPSDDVVSRQRVEVWRDDARGVTVERLFDEQDRVVAGVWSRHGGARTSYRAGESPREGVALPASHRTSLRDAWRHTPSATNFMSFVGLIEDADLEVRGTEYVLSYRPMPAPRNGLIEVTLTLTRDDHRATAATMVLREDGQVHQLTFNQTTLRHVRAAAVAPEVFTPEPQLLGATAVAPEAAVTPPPAPPAERVTPRLTDERLDQLELLAMHRLHREGIWVGHGATVDRSATRLLVSAVVPSTETELAITEEFTALTARGEIELDIAVAPPAEPGDDVRAALLEAVARRRVHLEVLESLMDEWPDARLRKLPLELVVTWQVMVQEHAEAIASTTDQIRSRLNVSSGVGVPAPGGAPVFLSTLSEASDAVRQLSVIVRYQDATLAAAYGGCPNPPCAEPDVSQLGPSFATLNSLASRFLRFYLKVGRDTTTPAR